MEKLFDSPCFSFLLLLIITSFFGCQETTSSRTELATPTVQATTSPKTKTHLLWAPSIDTTWVVDLYVEANQFTPLAQIEEYQQFDLHHAAVVKILTHLYGQEATFQDRLRRLECNRQQFYQAIRQGVLDDYTNYHSLEGMDFEFLCARQDSTVKTLLIQLLTDKKSTADQKVAARQTLRQYYSIVQ